MNNQRKTAIVTGASQGIGAGIVKAFAKRGFNVVANSRKVTQSTEVAASNQVALVDGHIGEPATAAKIIETALSRFKSIDVLVNNAGIFITKPFTDSARTAGCEECMQIGSSWVHLRLCLTCGHVGCCDSSCCAPLKLWTGGLVNWMQETH